MFFSPLRSKYQKQNTDRWLCLVGQRIMFGKEYGGFGVWRVVIGKTLKTNHFRAKRNGCLVLSTQAKSLKQFFIACLQNTLHSNRHSVIIKEIELTNIDSWYIPVQPLGLPKFKIGFTQTSVCMVLSRSIAAGSNPRKSVIFICQTILLTNLQK